MGPKPEAHQGQRQGREPGLCLFFASRCTPIAFPEFPRFERIRSTKADMQKGGAVITKLVARIASQSQQL